MIWRFATRPNVPGVHQFTLADPNWEGNNDIGPELRMKWYDAGDPSYLCAPRPQSGHPVSWTSGNQLTYKVDFALWEASRESRRIMELEFNRPYENQGSCEIMRHHGRCQALSCLTFFNGEDEMKRYINIRPHEGFFILRPRGIRLENWASFAMECWEVSRNTPFAGLRNIGIEFNSA